MDKDKQVISDLQDIINILEEELEGKKEKINILQDVDNLKNALEGVGNTQISDVEYNKSESISLQLDSAERMLEELKDVEVTEEDKEKYIKLLDYKRRLKYKKLKMLEKKLEKFGGIDV